MSTGVYRPYFQSYTRDNGATWEKMTPIQGTGCARPRLLSLGVGCDLRQSFGQLFRTALDSFVSNQAPEGSLLLKNDSKPLLMSGGRICSENMTGIFVWLNPTGQPNQNWTRYSISYGKHAWSPNASLGPFRVLTCCVCEYECAT